MEERWKFALNSDCFLVKGAKRGAVYDLKSGDIYSIDETSARILEYCEKDYSINQICSAISKTKEQEQEIKDYFVNLEFLKLGQFLDQNQKIEKVALSISEQKLEFIWLEVTQKCNLKCIHCYSESASKVDSGKENGKSELSITQWQSVLTTGIENGCKNIQFIGGEPILFGNNIFVLIKSAIDLGYEGIEFFTNATLLTDKDIDLLAKYRVQICASIYSKRPEIHDRITRQKGSLFKTVQNLKKLISKGVTLRLATITMKYNEKYIKETVDFLKELGDERLFAPFDIVRPIGRGLNKTLLSKSLNSLRLKTEANFPKINKETFIQRQNFHPCWRGRICVSSKGDIIPCIMAKEEKIENLHEKPLSAILASKELNTYWKLSKNNIKTCKDCEYRYACSDCRPLAKGQTNDLYAKPKNCLYNPYQGEWLKN